MKSYTPFPAPFLDRLRHESRLSTIIGKRIKITKRGREYVACCPFHDEKSPSFTINDDKGFYHCFGCGAHGDVVGFIKEYEKLSYPQAVEHVARELGISMPVMSPAIARENDLHMQRLDVMQKAAQWFTDQLQDNASARAYLSQRGMAHETLQQFALGYAPASRNALMQWGQSQGFSQHILLELGLLSRTDTDTVQDKFRDRIMFPIHDVSGRVIAFGGRAMRNDGFAPKYLNSPETPLFHKGNTLYNAHRARKAASSNGALVIAEGYMDVIALHEAGIAHAVAPLGTAITHDQLQAMWQMADTPTLCLDGDKAGISAMLKVLNMALALLTTGKSLQFVFLGAGDDPDSLLRSQGAQALQQTLSRAVPLDGVLWQYGYQLVNHDTPEREAAAEAHLMEMVNTIADPRIRKQYQQTMKDRLWKARSPLRKEKTTASKGQSLLGTLSVTANPTQSIAVRLLALSLSYPTLLARADIEAALSEIQLDHPLLQDLKDALFESMSEHGDTLSREHIKHTLSVHAPAKLVLWQQVQSDVTLKKLLQLPPHEGIQHAEQTALALLQRWHALSMQHAATQPEGMNMEALRLRQHEARMLWGARADGSSD